MKNPKQILIVLVVAGLAFVAKKYGLVAGDAKSGDSAPHTRQVEDADRPPAAPPSRNKPKTERTTKPKGELSAIDKAYRDKKSEVWLEQSGVVTKLLRDDLEGKKHQKWLVRIESGLTVLFAHNIDIAPRIPLRPGDKIEFRGRYEYSDRGGVMHWTHKHPTGYHSGGWIDYKGKRYR